ncbi:hypothetical protein GYMLUDRAFT_578374 [Collybiopsis luxurians FD-317 M1]|uniref:Transcription factor domain-containing protein n=1 Tax=Collybiopsis luxurians FD-317 M1 TaxID=944289 RepID=A0A0D0CGP2_9AGAR|nr:hypothetical protein GYMLUDRAFT_578374 [Collybiopsis luxurians FD-317 M1]
MTVPLSLGDYSRPSSALSCVVYFLGLHLSGATADEETAFLSKALSQVSNILSTHHPLRLIHGTQAEILLSTYFFRTGRYLEGKYHLSSAVSLAACAGLHKLRSGSPDSFSPGGLMGAGGPLLPEPQDSIDEGERINGFWTVFTLCNCWGVGVGGFSSMMFESFGSHIDTPWPLDMEDYEENRIPPNYIGASTVRRFLSQVPLTHRDHASSKMALYAQSSLLLERAANLASSYTSELHPDEHARYMRNFTSLDSLIDTFRTSLPPLSQTPSTSPDFFVMWLTHLICYTATIKLHNAFASSNSFSRKKVLRSAENCVLSGRGHDFSHVEVMNPIFGILWRIVGLIIIEEIMRLDQINSQALSMPSWGVEDRVMGRRVEMVALLEELFLTTEVFACNCKTIGQCDICQF